MGLKVTGKNPPEFGDSVTPTVDVADFYGLTNLSTQIATGMLHNSGDTLTLTVPAGYVWRVHSLGLRMALIQAADDCVAFLGVQLNASAVIAPLLAGSIWSGLAHNDNLYCVARYFDRPFLAPPGALLTGYLAANQGAGAVNSSLTALVEAFQL